MNNKKIYGAIAITFIVAVLALFSGLSRHGTAGLGASVQTNYPASAFSNVTVGSGCDSSYSTCTGTQISQVMKGTCTIFAYATTIAATSTGDVECQAGASALSALSQVTLGDQVFATLSTSTPTTVGGLVLESASASTTAGYIHMKILNLTGTTFTWTAAASSSVGYIDLR